MARNAIAVWSCAAAIIAGIGATASTGQKVGEPASGGAEGEGQARQEIELAVLTLEMAPGSLGEIEADESLLLAASPDGGSLYVLDSAATTVRRYSESGRLLGEPLKLHRAQGQFGTIRRIAAGTGGRLLLQTYFELAVCDPEGWVVHQRPLFMVGDVAATDVGGWAASLTHLGHGGTLVGREEWKGAPPRVLELSSKLESRREGLVLDEEDISLEASTAAGRALSLAWDGDRLFATELANYTVYELDSSYDLRTTFREPTLQFDEGLADSGNAEPNERLTVRAERMLERQGRPATAPEASSEEQPVVGSFNFYPVILDSAWDSESHRLVLLLNRTIVGDGPALDFLDPRTGEVVRFKLHYPEGVHERDTLSQLAVGDDYLWMRSHAGDQATWRVERPILLERDPIVLPEMERVGEVENEEAAALKRTIEALAEGDAAVGR